MAEKSKTLGELFDEIEAEAAAIPLPAPLTPEQLAKRQADQLQEDIRKGLRDASGEWIETQEPDEDENDEDDEDDEDDDQ